MGDKQETDYPQMRLYYVLRGCHILLLSSRYEWRNERTAYCIYTELKYAITSHGRRMETKEGSFSRTCSKLVSSVSRFFWTYITSCWTTVGVNMQWTGSSVSMENVFYVHLSTRQKHCGVTIQSQPLTHLQAVVLHHKHVDLYICVAMYCVTYGPNHVY